MIQIQESNDPMEWIPHGHSHLPSSKQQQLAIVWSSPMHDEVEINRPPPSQCTPLYLISTDRELLPAKMIRRDSANRKHHIQHWPQNIYKVDREGHNIDLDVICNNFCLMGLPLGYLLATSWLPLGYLLANSWLSPVYLSTSGSGSCHYLSPRGQKVKPSLRSGGQLKHHGQLSHS